MLFILQIFCTFSSHLIRIIHLTQSLYRLESFQRTSLSSQAQAARFLEQATFGSTRDDINSLVSTSLDYEGWVTQQLNLPISSLREYYRKRANPKYEFPWFMGATGAKPCDMHSRWRKYAIASTDMIDYGLEHVVLNKGTGYFEKSLIIEQVGGNYLWKVDGQFRTVTTNPPVDTNGTALALHTRYALRQRHIKGTIVGLSELCNCVGEYE